LSKDSNQIHRLTVSGKTWLVTELDRKNMVQRVEVDDEELSIRILKEPSVDQPNLLASIAGRVFIGKLEESGEGSGYVVRLNGRLFKISLQGGQQKAQNSGAIATVLGPMVITAPMSGRIVSLKASPELLVHEGEPIAVLEAMKMENEIAAPKTGTVREVYVKPGALVKAGDRLCLMI